MPEHVDALCAVKVLLIVATTTKKISWATAAHVTLCFVVWVLFLQTISRDANAEKLSVRYEPHVCLTRDALIRLLNNNGPDFAEQWELPVCVKLSPGVGKVTRALFRDVCRMAKIYNIHNLYNIFLLFLVKGSKEMTIRTF